MKPLMTKADVAKCAGVTPAAVRAWAETGQLPVLKTESGVRLFQRDDVTRFLRRRDRQQLRRSDGRNRTGRKRPGQVMTGMAG